MKRIYTAKMHKHRLRQMFAGTDPCGKCPAARRFRGANKPNELWAETPRPCEICLGFVGVDGLYQCPCHALGEKEAIRRTLAKLNEKEES